MGGAAGGEDGMGAHSDGKGQRPHKIEARHGESFILKLLRPVGHNRGPDKVLIRSLVRGDHEYVQGVWESIDGSSLPQRNDP